MTVRTATFAGIKYDIDLCGPIDGCCDKPHDDVPSIRIMADLNTQKGFITLIHEALHASRWAAHEETVDRTSKDIGRLLWRLGFRCPQTEGDSR
jgi:hypothetical protein